jgi:sugar lactone lactonase YvrE
MTPLDLYFFLTSYTLTVAAAAVVEYLRHREPKFLITVAVAIAVIPANAIVGAYLDPEKSIVDIFRYLIRVRDFSVVMALLMGVAAGLVWCTRYHAQREIRTSSIWGWFEPTLLALSIGLVVLCGQAYLWTGVLGSKRHAVSAQDPEFVIEKLADLDDHPLRLALGDNGEIFICHDYFMKHGAFGGAIQRFSPDPATGKFEKRTVAESPFLARCYGLARRDGDLYVSRSGFFPRIVMGNVNYESTGAVTQLKDLDGDGYFEYANDVLTGLPGVRAPDTPQQNNGIVFGSDGSLYVTVSVAADRTLDEHPWGGTILKVSPDFTQTEIFAKGFRNTWTIAFGPDNQLFATDTDVDQNPGDEINHVIQGEHYGHPFVIPNEAGVEAIGFRDPILVGGSDTVFTGMAYTASPSLPEKYRNCLYVTDFRQNQVLRIQLERSGDTYKVAGVYPFARVPTPVDLAITPEGEFFVLSRRADKLYRIRLKQTAE